MVENVKIRPHAGIPLSVVFCLGILSLVLSLATPVAASDSDPVQFGKPTVVSSHGITTVKVMVKNVSGRKLNCVLIGTFLNGDTILGTANGALNDVGPGSTKTAQLMTVDNVKGYETLKLEPGACF